MENEKTGPSFVARIVAVVVLAVAAWILFKVVIGVVAGVAWFVVVIVADHRRHLGGANAVLGRPPVPFLIIAFFFGLAGGVVGKIKGSSFLLWFLISAIPPFIGLVAAVLYRNEYDEPHRRCPTLRQGRAGLRRAVHALRDRARVPRARRPSPAEPVGSLTVHSDPASRRGRLAAHRYAPRGGERACGRSTP